MPKNDNDKDKRKKSKSARRKQAIEMLMKTLPALADSDSNIEDDTTPKNAIPKIRAPKESGHKKSSSAKPSGSGHTDVNDLLGNHGGTRDNSRAGPNDANERSKEEWRRNNLCFLDMHVGHAARDHKLARQEWQGPLSDRWNANREAWNAVRNLAPYKTPEEIATYFNVDISNWGPTSNIGLLIDIAECMGNDTRLWDGSSKKEPPRPKQHKWPEGEKPMVRKKGPASEESGTLPEKSQIATCPMTFGASPKKAKLKDRKKKRKFLESPAVGQNTADTRTSSGSAGPVVRSVNAGSGVPESEGVERALFPASQDTERTLEKHEKDIHAIHESL